MNFLVLLVFFVFSFAAAGAVVMGTVIYAGHKRRREGNPDQPAIVDPLGAETPGLLKNDELSSIAIWHELLARLDVAGRLRVRLDQADLNWSVGRFTMAMLLLATVGFAIVWQVSWLPLWLALFVAPGAGLLPYFYISARRAKRFEKFNEVFPDALDSMARALRSGSTVPTAFEVLAEEAEAPVSVEMRRTLAEINIGSSWERALDNLTTRVPMQEVSMFVAAVQIHSRTGGRLGEVMSRLAEGMREDNALRGEVRAIAAHGKLTGLILTVLPLGIAGMMLAVSPEYITQLFTHPWGKHMIAAAALCLVLAHVIIGRIVKVDA
ncbi:hypothetical protein F183_A45440 [Bryobacterales bacterium F-183]|nr:hypothetical protein F183_A45440 [Bryobacterales bacterium F-183]